MSSSASASASAALASRISSSPFLSLPADKQNGNEGLSRQPRQVQGLYTHTTPLKSKYKVLAYSPSALQSLNLTRSDELDDILSGNKTISQSYSQNYAGYQFGSFAGQLGDGRVIHLFRLDDAQEIQLKGAGLTPYSRFADGNAVLRSSIREFLVSEYLHALSIPTTRALSLIAIDRTALREEGKEPCAIVSRYTPSWIRIGTFDLVHYRRDNASLKLLADHACDTFNIPHDYTELYRQICLKNAKTCALWQTYGFMNGVLNTDNILISGCSLDFGPFAFIDTFNPSHTPNHDDWAGRYSYKMQPTVMWWNLVRLGESLSPLLVEEKEEDRIPKLEKLIEGIGEEYKNEFMKEYVNGVGARIGLKTPDKEKDMDLFSGMFDFMSKYDLDFHLFFRRLANVRIFTEDKPDVSFMLKNVKGKEMENAEKEFREWLSTYRKRLESESNTYDKERQTLMNKVNPAFILRNWVLQEVIDKVSKDQEDAILKDVTEFALSPFQDTWPDKQELFDHLTGDVEVKEKDIQCSCSS